MSVLTVQVNTGTDDTPTWTAVDADRANVVKRRGRGGYATFRIPNASVANRVTLRIGRTARLKLERDDDTLWFKGVLLEHRVISDGAGVFSLECTVGELAERAKYMTITEEVEYPQSLQGVTRTEFTATQDASVSEAAPTTNNGTSSLFLVGNRESPFLQDWSFVQWDISSIDSGDFILRAYVVLQLASGEVIDDSTPAAMTSIAFHNVLESWDEGTVTWNTAPDMDIDVDPDTNRRAEITSRDVFLAGIGHELSIAEFEDHFRQVHSGAITDFGIAIAPTAPAPYSILRFRSSEDSTADLRPKLLIDHQVGVPVSDVVEDLFTNFWSDVDITGIQATAEFVKLQLVQTPTEGGGSLGTVEGIRFDRFDNLYDAMELLTNQVPGWEWWLDTSDGDDIVLYFEEADQGTPAGIGESDILYPFEIEPENQRVINHVILFGPTTSNNLATKPVVGEARSTTSQGIYGYRPKIFPETTLVSRDLLNARAEEILHETLAEYWTVAIGVPESRAVLPGRQVFLNLPNYGLDGTNFQQDFVVQETRDRFERGYWTRDLVLREYIT